MGMADQSKNEAGPREKKVPTHNFAHISSFTLP